MASFTSNNKSVRPAFPLVTDNVISSRHFPPNLIRLPTHMQKLAELVIRDQPFAVLAEVESDEVAVTVEGDLLVQGRVRDNLLELL